MENFVNRKVLVKQGVRTREDDKHPNYPLLAWDGKGTRLAVLYNEKGKTKFFVYDLINKNKLWKQDIEKFDQIQDMKYMLDNNTLLFSGVRSGQTDIYVYKIDKQTFEQVTNDVYDDLDPSFAAFPNKTGILYSSNRPSANAASSDDSLPGKHFNIYLVDNWNKSEVKQISKMTDLKMGNARFPSQYNQSHFTFISDENGINNRYAGFFKTERAGLDTLIFIGDEMLRNPPKEEVDSLLKEWNKTDIDSVGFVSVTNDSSYTFPITNYQSSMLETRTAGDNQQISEVVKLGDTKLLYRLRVDENTLRRRNINARPTEYMRKVIEEEKKAARKESNFSPKTDTLTKKQNDFFNTGFDEEKKDSTKTTDPNATSGTDKPGKEPVLKNAKVYEYRPPKYFMDYVVSGFTNVVLPQNKFQPYAQGTGPIYLSNNNAFNGMLRMGVSDLMEDYKFMGGFRVSPNLNDNEVMVAFINQRKKLDWGITYYRSKSEQQILIDPTTVLDGKVFQNYYLATLKYPLDKVRSLRATLGPRFDKQVFVSESRTTLGLKDNKTTYGQLSVEYVFDNTSNPAQNIWNGLRYKIFADVFSQISKPTDASVGKFLYSAGFDARHYLPIYRNIIWAMRAGGDFSWGPQKVVYYLGGIDNWLKPRFNNANKPDPDNTYTYQSLAVNLRGFDQNVSNGNNAVVINSEIRVPVFSSLFNKPINNAFLRNFQIVQFFDLGAAWNGSYDKIERPNVIYTAPGSPVSVKLKAGGIGPFAGGYGFGARSTLLGYFLRVDAAWEMKGVFRGKPQWYFGMGLDF